MKKAPISKGDLNDSLQAIDVEESPLVQEDLIESGKDKAKRVKASKKLKFDDQVDQFVFKPRRPITRNFKQIQEVLPRADETREIKHNLMKERIKEKQLTFKKKIVWKS